MIEFRSPYNKDERRRLKNEQARIVAAEAARLADLRAAQKRPQSPQDDRFFDYSSVNTNPSRFPRPQQQRQRPLQQPLQRPMTPSSQQQTQAASRGVYADGTTRKGGGYIPQASTPLMHPGSVGFIPPPLPWDKLNQYPPGVAPTRVRR